MLSHRMRTPIIIGLAIIALSFASCDKVDNPYITKQGGSKPTVPPTRVDSTTPASDDTLQVLLEDYTAHACTNCPTGSHQCELFLNSHPNQVVFMEVNTDNSLGKPFPLNTFGSSPPLDSGYMVDYRTSTGDAWNALFINTSANGMPGTMVNRLYFSGAAGSPDLYLIGKDVSVPGDSIINDHNRLASIHIVDSMYAPPTSALSMSIRCQLLHPVAGNKYFLVVGLVEDSIFDWQDSLSNNLQYYLKRMTFRAAVNGPSGAGDSLSNNTSFQLKHYVYTNTNQFVNNSAVIFHPTALEGAKWNMAHTYIVAFIYQTVPSGKGNYYVLQAQKLHI